MMHLINEEVSQSEFNQIEKALTDFFKKFKIDVFFKSHFRDRVNDSRNSVPITRERLIEIANKLMQEKNFRKLSAMKFGQEGVMIYKDVNFVYTLDKVKGNVQLRFITAMSKEGFKPNSNSDFILKLEALKAHYLHLLEKL